MVTAQLTNSQHSIINAIMTLIEGLDDNMRTILLHKLEERQTTEARSQPAGSHVWADFPIPDDVMEMTFAHRKTIPQDYESILEQELKEKYI